MTRKHFIELAKILAKHEASKELIQDMAIFCILQNPRFVVNTFKDKIQDLKDNPIKLDQDF